MTPLFIAYSTGSKDKILVFVIFSLCNFFPSLQHCFLKRYKNGFSQEPYLGQYIKPSIYHTLFHTSLYNSSYESELVEIFEIWASPELPYRWGEIKQHTLGMDVICNRKKDMYLWGPGKGVGKNTVTVKYKELSGLCESVQEFDLKLEFVESQSRQGQFMHVCFYWQKAKWCFRSQEVTEMVIGNVK